MRAAIEAGDSDTIAKEQRELTSKIDKAVQKGAMHKNTGARKKAKAARMPRRPPPLRRLQTGASRRRYSVTAEHAPS